MQKNFSILVLISMFATLLNATIVRVPHEYDNTFNSIRSKATLVIHDGLGTTSSMSKILAGQNVRYKCVTIDKLPCRGALPAITLSVTDVIIMDPTDKLLAMYGYEAFSEDAGGDQWHICGAAVGGYSWDTSSLTTSPMANNTIINYKYTPNTQNKTFMFFTTSGSTGSNKSHMVIDVQQKCR